MIKPEFNNLTKLDTIVNSTIEAINNSKEDLSIIANEARVVSSHLEKEYYILKDRVGGIILEISILENDISASKNEIYLINKDSANLSPDEIKNALEKCGDARKQLILKRNEEQIIIKRRNDLELQLKETLKTLAKAENVLENIGSCLNILTDDLQKVSDQIDNIRSGQQMGIKIIKAQEDERQRVAREIHDGPAQILSNVVIKSEICDRLLDSDTPKAKQELNNLKTTLADCLIEVKRIVYNLRPLSLEENGLTATIENYFRSFSTETGIVTEYEAINPNDDVGSGISLTIFRIVQECLSNIKKHSEATKVSLTLDFTDTCIKLSISDNGKGFGIQKHPDKQFSMDHGFGLISMKERVKLLSGQFQIESFPGEGVSLEVLIPLSCEYNTKGDN